ncbi:MAG: hypothetical protein ACR2PT_03550 [Endozoicomonas sp.]
MNIKQLTAAASIVATGAAMAHPGDHSYSVILHFFSQPDHLLMLAIAGVAGSIAVTRMVKAKRG